MADTSQLRSVYPLGKVFDAFVTNVHNIPQLRFFMFVKNTENLEHFANVRYASTPPNAYKCVRIPREGYVFALRLAESTMVRAIRLRTMCITKTREVFLPDVGRTEMLNDEDDLDMYHLPLKLRAPPGLAIPCQLRGVNDDVTILPHNMRTFLRGLLFHNVKLRVDGYIGGMLKVQLLDVTIDQLVKWTAELGVEEYDFQYALKHTFLYEPKNIEPLEVKRLDNKDSKTEKMLSPILELPSSSEEEESYGNEKNCLSAATISIPTTSSSFRSSSPDSWLTALDDTIVPGESSSVADEDMFYSTISTLTNSNCQDSEESFVEQHDNTKDKMISSDFEDVSNELLADMSKDSSAANLGLRPLLGYVHNTQVRPILGGVSVPMIDNSWKRDALPALMIIDNRQTRMYFARDDLLTITPTYIGQLERFFGIVHRRNANYMQHMWVDDEIPLSSRYTGLRFPYVFDIVLAKHSGDFKWYRAKVIEISKEQRKVLVFFVDYGGTEYVDLRSLASVSRSISKLTFQAILFRWSDLIDATTTKAERSFGVEYLCRSLLKKTFNARVVSCRGQEISISFEDQRFSNVPATLIRKGFMKPIRAMV